MITKKIKQSKVAKFLAYFVVLGIIYAGTSFLLLILAGPIFNLGRAVFSTNDILTSGILFFLLFLCTYIFVLRNEKLAKYKVIQRGLLYALFFGFSAVAMFTILTPALNYIDFLRFKIGDVNLKGIFVETTFWMATACFITYTVFTSLMEIQKNKTRVLRQLIYWFVATIIAGYSSLVVLFFYTGFDYQKKCLPKIGTASDYCYNIGGSIYHWWQPIPALIVFIIVTLFMILYFAKLLKKKEK